MLKCLPLLKACNQQVDFVDKRHCSLAAVPHDILQYRHSLEELLLDGNQIKGFPREFFLLSQLRKLTLSDNEIFHLPADIGNLIHLQELDISRNDIEDIPEDIKYCKHLQILDLSSNPLQSLPDGFMHLLNLTHLCLNDVSFNRIPYDIGSLTNLESLELRENLIKYIPSSLPFLVKLRALDLGNNAIDVLPGCIGCLPCLEELWLDCNELTEVPWEIGNLKHLTQLDLSDNKLEFLPDEIGGMSCLTDFILTHNHLEVLPHGIGNLKRLLILKVEQNLLIELTPQIGNCENLQELLLTENLLAKLPATIGNLKLLSNFNVDRNQLTEIPGEIGDCTMLSVLSVRDNKISQLPPELGNMTNLHVLDVCGNRLQNLPVTLSSCSLKAIWLSENQVQSSIKFQQEFDEETGLMVLTCFMLPQLNARPMLARQFESRPTLLSGKSISTDDGLSWPQDTRPISSVKFALENRSDDEVMEPERHLVRQDTPHSKELRNTKLTKKVSHLQTPDTDEESFAISSGQENGNTASPSSRSSDVSFCSKASTVKVLIDIHEDKLLSWHYLPAQYQQLHEPRQSPIRLQCPPNEHFMPQQQQQQSRFSTGFHADNEFIFEEEFERNTGQISSQEATSAKHDIGGSVKPEGDVLSADSEQFAPRVGGSALVNRTRHVLLRQSSNCDSFEGTWCYPQSDSLKVETAPEISVSYAKLDEPVEGEESLLSAAGTGEHILRIFVLHDPDVPLGMSIAGGVKTPGEGVYISRVIANGPSDSAGLRTGDRILSINDTDVRDLDHNSIVMLLRQPGMRISLTVARKPDNAIDILRLRRNENGFGFTIAGGHGSTPFEGNDQSIYISRITEGGAAHEDGRLRVGDKLLSVNGYDMSKATHDEAVLLLTSAVGEIMLVVKHEDKFSPHLNDAIDLEQEPFLKHSLNGTLPKGKLTCNSLDQTYLAKPRGHFDVLPAIIERNSPISLQDGNRGDDSWGMP